MGTKQSGILDLKIAYLSKDGQILMLARKSAVEILSSDPLLEKNENLLLRNKMIEVLKQNILYDESEKCYQANYIYNEEIKHLPSYEMPVLRMQTNLERNWLVHRKRINLTDKWMTFLKEKFWNGYQKMK